MVLRYSTGLSPVLACPSCQVPCWDLSHPCFFLCHCDPMRKDPGLHPCLQRTGNLRRVIYPRPQLIIQRLKFSIERGSSSVLLWSWPGSPAPNGRMTNLEQACPRPLDQEGGTRKGTHCRQVQDRRRALQHCYGVPRDLQMHCVASQTSAKHQVHGNHSPQESLMPRFSAQVGTLALHRGYKAHLRASSLLGDLGKKK